ncbi:MAG: hypothetical protein R2912_10410 [Eubacteriales bacterium]
MSYEVGTICTDAPVPAIEDCVFRPGLMSGTHTKLLELKRKCADSRGSRWRKRTETCKRSNIPRLAHIELDSIRSRSRSQSEGIAD